MYKGYAVLIGGLLAVMIMVNAGLKDFLGQGPALIVIHIVGLVSITIFLLFKGEKIRVKSNLPFYFYISGALGICIVIINSITFFKIGAALTIATTAIGQIVISVIVDHYGLLGVEVNKFDFKKITGFIFVFIGLAIMVFWG